MQCFRITREKKLSASEFKGVIEENEQVLLIMSKDEIRHYNTYFNWPSRTIHTCLSNKPIPQVEVYEKFDFGVLQKITFNSNQYMTQPFSFYIASNYLVLIYYSKDQWIETFCQSLIKEQEAKYDMSYVFFRLLDEVIQSDYYYLDNISKEIGELEENVLNEEDIEFSKEIITIRKNLAIFKRHYDPLVDIMEDFVGNENSICSSQGVRYFKMLKSRVSRLRMQVDSLGEYATHVREAYDAQVDIKQNRIMKYFTFITSVFLPLTLIAGWYGMNFTTMPELTWKYGYIYVIVISLLSSFLCLYCFKKKRWM